MPTFDDCIDLITAARASAEDPESAYLVRTRLKRCIVAVGQAVATEFGLESPAMPEQVEGLTAADPATAEILTSCNRVLGASKALCEPSEALDSRWRDGWTELDRELAALQDALEVSAQCREPKGLLLTARGSSPRAAQSRRSS